MATDSAALQRELQELRDENAALLEALRLAQRGGADLRGHLSKWNPDAGQQGIFAQDWELRYFVLSGTLLKYYNSERDVGYDPRGVLELQDCTVEVELPVRSTGPFIFQIADPDNEMLLRLSADRLETAKAWVRALQAAGLYVQHLHRFTSHQQGSGFGSGFEQSGQMASHRSAPHLSSGEWQMGGTVGQQQGVAGTAQAAAAAAAAAAVAGDHQGEAGGLGLRQRLFSLGRVLSFRPQSPANSMDSDVSVMRVRRQHPAHKPAAAAAAAAAADDSAVGASTGPKVELRRPATFHGGESLSEVQQQQQQQQGSQVGQGGINLQQLRRLLSRTHSSRRWVVGGDNADDDDETGVTTALSIDEAVQPQLSATGSTTGAPLSAQTSTSGLPAGPEGLTPAAAAAAAAAGGDVAAAAAEQAAAAAAGNSKTGGSTRPRRQPLDGASAVHTVVKDSVLTWQDDWRISRHEGLLNLGVVVLLATNIRLIMSNIFTYGWKVKVDPASMQAALRGLSSPDDAITWAAVLACMAFYAAALLIERLGLVLLQREARMRSGLAKKDVTAAAASRKLAAAAAQHEWLLFLLNAVNVGASLLLPCGMVLHNKSTLMPASTLTMVSIITCMKLTTYAHCNTTLRCQARKKAATDAAAASDKAAVAAALADAPAATTDTPFASISASGLASELQNHNPQNPKNGSESGSASGFTVYPQNLNLADVAYYMLAPTLTYQLNFPRMKRRRVRLLRRWMLLLLGALLLMSFMQVQFLLPLMQSSLMPLHETNLLRFTERLLRLSVPNVAHWLIMFYLVFHLWLNILGELLMFGDRLFYKEWWNAATLGDYWRLWNIPVHKWMLRTIFFPLMRRRVGKFPAMLLVFFLSAVMHELAVAVPLRMLRGWAFWGMFLQVPLVSLTEMLRKRLKSDTLGNMIFWASFCVLGQPMCLILYYHDYVLANMGMQGLAKAAAAGAGAAASAAVGSLAGEGVGGVVAAATAAR